MRLINKNLTTFFDFFRSQPVPTDLRSGILSQIEASKTESWDAFNFAPQFRTATAFACLLFVVSFSSQFYRNGSPDSINSLFEVQIQGEAETLIFSQRDLSGDILLDSLDME
ncbi:MAG: hypothetical protein ACI9BD_000670 [Candidatus Marinamargulisbacteria bacterium]|jgi:hypothetical protein